jgi:hypothetical protein
MKIYHLIGLMALMPAALNASPAAAAAAAGLAVPLCTGDGVARVINLPLGTQDVPGKQVPGCCVKGCHSGESRKRSKKCC